MSGSTTLTKALDPIVYDGAQGKPERNMLVDTAIFAMTLDIRAQVDVAAGGGADGTLMVEQPLRLVKRVRIFDGSEAIVDVDPRPLLQIANARNMQPSVGVALTTATIQAATQVRQQIQVYFSDPWSKNPGEVYLKFKNKEQARLQIEWAGVEAVGLANGVLAGSLITGGTRSTVVTNLAVDVMIEHDPVLFLQHAPLYVPRYKTYEGPAVQTTQRFPFELKTGNNRLRSALIWTVDTDVTTNFANFVTFEDQKTKYDEIVSARTWHEWEQARFGGVPDTGLDAAYLFKDWAHKGMLSKTYKPGQGAKPQFTVDLVGGAARAVRVVTCELEQVSGLTAVEQRPAWAD